MWKDSWEIIAAKPAPRLNKGPAVEQEVGSSAALCRQESSPLPQHQWFGVGKVKADTETTKSPESPQCVRVEMGPANLNRQRDGGRLEKHGKYEGKEVLLIDKERLACPRASITLQRSKAMTHQCELWCLCPSNSLMGQPRRNVVNNLSDDIYHRAGAAQHSRATRLPLTSGALKRLRVHAYAATGPRKRAKKSEETRGGGVWKGQRRIEKTQLSGQGETHTATQSLALQMLAIGSVNGVQAFGAEFEYCLRAAR